MRRVVFLLLLAILSAGCATAATLPPSPTPSGPAIYVATIAVPAAGATPTATSVMSATATITLTATPINLNTATPAKYHGPVPEGQGNYVTSALPKAHYYYYYTDQRWKTMDDRVWFATLPDLLAAYPDRKPAP